MTAVALLLAAALGAACVLYVARPFLREPEPESDTLEVRDAAELRRLALQEERDRALAALKELEFDHRTGAISDEDYRAQVGPQGGGRAWVAAGSAAGACGKGRPTARTAARVSRRSPPRPPSFRRRS